MLLYSSIVDLVVGVSVLARQSALIGIPVLLRAALEVYADLLIVLRDPNGCHCLHAGMLHDQVRLFRSAKDNRALRDLREPPNLAAIRDATRNELAEYAKNGVHPLTVKERFECARIGEMYGAAYWLLSNAAHSSLSELSKRHIRGANEIEAIEVFSPLFHQSAYEHLVVAIALLVDATAELQAHNRPGNDCGLREVRGIFLELQQRHPPRIQAWQ